MANMLSDYQMTVIAALNMTSSILSILGGGSIILCALKLKKVALAEVFPLFQLSFGDFIASLLLVVSCILELSKVDPYHPGHQSACDFIQGTTSSLFVTTFLLTMLYAVEAYLRLKKRVNNEPVDPQKLVSHNIIYLFYVLCWLLPCVAAIIIVSISTADENQNQNDIPPSCSSCLPVFHYNEDICYSTLVNGPSWHIVQKLFFLIPLIVVIVIIVVLYICVNKLVKTLSISRGYRNRRYEVTVLSKTLQYQVVFACCWSSSLVLGLASFFHDFGMESFFAAYILQAVLGPLQGFLNCIVYGWNRPNFRRSITENTPLSAAANRLRETTFSRNRSARAAILSDSEDI